MKKNLALIGFAFVLLAPALALAAQEQVTLSTNSISPSTVDVNVGDTVVWDNTSATTQSVTSDNSAFQSGSIAPGGQFAATFNQTGTYNYYDDAAGSAILGEVIVSGTSVSTPTTTTYVNPNTSYIASNSANTNSSVASLTAEVQSLIAEIDALEGGSSSSVSGAPTYTSGGSCPQIGRVLSLGSSGSDVASLQQFLATSVGYTGGATGYYGTLTQAAVEQYQTANNIISYGTPATTGYGVVGPRTEAAIRLSCSGGTSTSGTTSGSGGVVSGFLQVSPISGDAPLTVEVTATVNTAESCGGGTYILDFGDGTEDESISVASGDCSQQNEVFPHTYQYGGTYTITLSSGSHSSTASVTVSGPEGSTSVTAPTDATEASGSMTAFITTGPAPLATTFYVSCAAGLAYDVVFGDGTDLGSSGVSQSSCNGGLQSIAHTYTAVGSYTAQLIVFTRNSEGTVSSQTVASQGITVTGTTSSSSSSGSSSYQAPTLTPDVSGNPLEVSLQYNADSSGCETTINWGDGSTTGPSGCSSLTGELQTYTQTHTYSQAGNYTVTLQRVSQTDTVGVAISD